MGNEPSSLSIFGLWAVLAAVRHPPTYPCAQCMCVAALEAAVDSPGMGDHTGTIDFGWAEVFWTWVSPACFFFFFFFFFFFLCAHAEMALASLQG